MAKKDLSYKYDTCDCGTRKLKRSIYCRACFSKVQFVSVQPAKKIESKDGQCLICSSPLKPKQKAFCGLNCRHKHSRIENRNCKRCGVTFKPKTSKSCYCTNECANKHKSELYRLPDSKMQRQKKHELQLKKNQTTCKLDYSRCSVCGRQRANLKARAKNGVNRFCSKKCEKKNVHIVRVKRGLYVHKAGYVECLYCGERKWFSKHASKMFCSSRCSQKHQHRVRDLRIKDNKKDITVTLPRLIKRDGWECKRCGTTCQMPKGLNTPDEATVDHVIPISKGGPHTWDNVQLLCRECNTAKRDTDWQVFNSAAMTK